MVAFQRRKTSNLRANCSEYGTPTLLFIILCATTYWWAWIQIEFDTPIGKQMMRLRGSSTTSALVPEEAAPPAPEVTVAAVESEQPAVVAPAEPPLPPVNQWCSYCEWNGGKSCKDRIDYLEGTYGSSREDAQKELMERDGICKK
jgi:hypothetical protein